LHAFKPDGVIFFSDILTPLPALGIEFDVIKGKGPAIAVPLRSMDQVRGLYTHIRKGYFVGYKAARGRFAQVVVFLLIAWGRPRTLAKNGCYSVGHLCVISSLRLENKGSF
jgi:hypothetical protein